MVLAALSRNVQYSDDITMGLSDKNVKRDPMYQSFKLDGCRMWDTVDAHSPEALDLTFSF